MSKFDQLCIPPCGSPVTQLPSSRAPIITSIVPNTGPAAGGTTVVITGTNITDATAVRFGTNNATFAVDSDRQITAVSPPL
jgi:hypothetical protein